MNYLEILQYIAITISMGTIIYIGLDMALKKES